MTLPTIEKIRLEANEVNESSLRDYREREQVGDAELFACRSRDRVAFDHSTRTWYLWRGNFWEDDRTGEVYNLMFNRIAAEYGQAGASANQAGDKDEAKAFYNRAKALLRKRYVTDALSLAEKQPGVALMGNEWDRAPMLLGVNNGVIDLTTGTHRTGQPGEYMRVHSPIDWLGIDQPAPAWEQFMLEVFDGEAELVNFMQRLFGYCLTGKTSEHRLPILWGGGRNGKSTLLQALAFVFGNELSHTTQADALMDVKRDGAGAQPFVHALRGRRLVWATESREGQRVNAGLIKQLTGGDSITTRTLYSDVVTFNPSHKVMLLTNHKPHMSAEDQALWDRVLLIPFTNRFVDDPKRPGEYKRNPRLLEELQEEASGILAWLVRGCLQWQAEGLNPPEQVIAATEEYRQEEDTIGEFISDCLIVEKNKQARAKDLYAKYTEWTKDNGIEPMSNVALAKRLKLRHFEKSRDGKSIIYLGVGVLE
jgi:putative DNA primase/helicase